MFVPNSVNILPQAPALSSRMLGFHRLVKVPAVAGTSVVQGANAFSYISLGQCQGAGGVLSRLADVVKPDPHHGLDLLEIVRRVIIPFSGSHALPKGSMMLPHLSRIGPIGPI